MCAEGHRGILTNSFRDRKWTRDAVPGIEFSLPWDKQFPSSFVIPLKIEGMPGPWFLESGAVPGEKLRSQSSRYSVRKMRRHMSRPIFHIWMFLLTVGITHCAGIGLHASASDQIPGAPQKRPVALVNAVLHPVSGPEIDGAKLVFEAGRITNLGRDIEIPANAEIVDVKGNHVYPGLIESHSQIGLTEISSTRATLDFAESGNLNPNVSAHIAVNPDSELIPVTRSNGVLVALSAPSGGLISGKASVMQLDGWTFEDMTLKQDVALVIQWPRMSSPSRRSGAGASATSAGSEQNQVDTLRSFFDESRGYLKSRAANQTGQRFDIRYSAMQPVLEGRLPLIAAANYADQIQSAVSFALEQQVRIIIFGGYDAAECAELLRQYDIPVVIEAIHQTPLRRHDDYDASFTLPERLRRAGVRFCISGSGRSETWNARNLPYQAATAVAYGLPREEALRSITRSAAEILGISERVGSLEKHKDATLFVCDGDPLETDTQVTAAWIRGRRTDLRNRQTQLYEKYSQKYRQLDDAR